MKSFFRNLSRRSSCLGDAIYFRDAASFYASLSRRRRPSVLECAVCTSPKSRRLRMEPLENRELLAVDAFAASASSVDSDVGASWAPDPEPAFSAAESTTESGVAATPTGATSPTNFANATYDLQCESGGGTATPIGIPDSWPCAVGEPSVDGENAIVMTATLSGAPLNDDSKYCVAASNNMILPQQNAPETASARPRVAVTAVQNITWHDLQSSNLTRLQDDPHDSGTAQRFFPEQISATSGVVANQVKAIVTLAAPVPVGMTGTVSVNWFDPANPIGSETEVENNEDGPGKRDNNGAASLSGSVLTFSQTVGASAKSVILTVTQANAGDNYVVAAHPNASGLATYRIVDAGAVPTQSSTLKYVANASDAPFVLPTNLQTPKLTVWRTLWVECDRMIFNNSYAGETPVINEFVRYPFLTACIDVQTYGNNVDLDFIGSEYVDRTAQFAESEEFTESRSLPTPTKEYWTLRLISAFSWLPEDSSEQGAPGVFFAGFNTAFIFDKSLNEQIDAYNNGKSGENLLDDLDKELIRSQVTLHEMGHAFGLPDIARPQGQENTSYGVMTQEVGLLERLDFDYFTFTNPNIREMQKRVCPY